MAENNVLVAVGGVSMKTGQGFVEISPGPGGQLDAHETINSLVAQLSREAWWAESDAALIEFLVNVLDFKQDHAAVFLQDFRRHRYSRLEQLGFVQATEARAAYEERVRARIKEQGWEKFTGGEGGGEGGQPGPRPS